jgi:hypothetical protein
MDASHLICDSVVQVERLRQTAASTPGLARAVSAIKQFQARRFAGTYQDLLHAKPYQAAARFFLDELYSEKDYAERDTQFARIAGGLARFFPQEVTQTAISLAQLHLLTETLDLAMARHWLSNANADASANTPDPSRYISAWRAVGRREDRHMQLANVLALGRELDHLTRTPGLRFMLKMMRGPANLARLGALQRFLEAGFDTFADMGRQAGGATFFLETVHARESHLFTLLFEGDLVACETELAQTLAQAR